MSKSENEPENFLARWSARKLADRRSSTQEHDAAPEQDARDENGAVENSAVENSADAEPRKDGDTADDQRFDAAQLPPLDAIGADTTIADFLRPGVPPELTRAALRRAWTSDPAIKNFVGLVENGWDFNDPAAMPGFGPISAEEVARLAGKLIEALPADQTKDESPSEPTSQRAGTTVRPQPHETKADTSAAPEGDAANDAGQQDETANKG